MAQMVFRMYLVLSSLFFCVPALSHTAVIYIDQNATGANSGISWSDAFLDLQSGLSIAISGDEIWVAEGIYKPSQEYYSTGDRYKTFRLKNGVGIYGGFKGNESAREERILDSNPTILSCDIGVQGDDSDNCYHVLIGSSYLTDSTILDGFVVTAGNSDGSSYSYTGKGGGLYNYAPSSTGTITPSINNCSFVNNKASRGGAIYNLYSKPNISKSKFDNNSATSNGGGMYNEGSSPELVDCIFNNNHAFSGGGIYNQYNYRASTTTVTNCIFSNNTAIYSGGGVTNKPESIIMNSVFYGNSSELGGGIHNFSSSPNIFNVINCILWGNIATDGKDIYPSQPEYFNVLNVSYSNIEEYYSGKGNISQNPLFVNPSFGDFHLKPGSPCINAGTFEGAPNQDFEGDPRPILTRIDIGVDEAHNFGGYEDFNEAPIDFTEDPYFSVSNGRLLFSGDPNLSSGARSVTWNGGDTPGGDLPLPGHSNYFENYTVYVDTSWEGRDTNWSYGFLLCGPDKTTGSHSCLGHRVNNEGEYSLGWSKGGMTGFLAPHTLSSLVNTDGENNQLSITKVGPYFYFSVNGIEVERRVIDDFFYGGRVGLYAFHPVDASFDNFAISEIDFDSLKDEKNQVIEDFEISAGGFFENVFYKISDGRLLFQGDRTNYVYFNIWGGGLKPGGMFPSYDNSNYFENFIVSVNTSRAGGDWEAPYGLITCSNSSNGLLNSVEFYISEDGWYTIGKTSNDVWEILVPWTEAAPGVIQPINKLAIQKNDNIFQFYISNVEVESLTINGYSGGGIGLSTHGDVDIRYDNFSIVVPGTPPIADAGVDQVIPEGNIVTLDGSKSTDDISLASYKWYQLAGPQVTLSDPSFTNPTFIAPDVNEQNVRLVFQLKIIDEDRLHDSDITFVDVSCVTRGDVNGDCLIDLKDVIIPLQVVTELSHSNVRPDYVASGVDVNGNDQIGMEEAVHTLRTSAGL